MKRKQGTREPLRRDGPPKVPGRARKIAAASATMIFALQSIALAKPGGTQQPTVFEGCEGLTDGIACVPVLEPGTMAALGATLATIGAYRLRKARGRNGQSKDERNEP